MRPCDWSHQSDGKPRAGTKTHWNQVCLTQYLTSGGGSLLQRKNIEFNDIISYIQNHTVPQPQGVKINVKNAFDCPFKLQLSHDMNISASSQLGSSMIFWPFCWRLKRSHQQHRWASAGLAHSKSINLHIRWQANVASHYNPPNHTKSVSSSYSLQWIGFDWSTKHTALYIIHIT